MYTSFDKTSLIPLNKYNIIDIVIYFWSFRYSIFIVYRIFDVLRLSLHISEGMRLQDMLDLLDRNNLQAS